MVWAISDLHLPARQKPMDIFGPHWANHFERISADWIGRVQPQDVVLLPGDLSWAMHLEEAQEDLARIGALPGIKLLLRGNHDFWWSSIGRVRRMLPEGCFALQNDS
ncbi:MAG: metallophosphoesterase, partial [Eubacteriales bacterium]|nr:metallophosphoesterase [Eubacteriales bacterium]